MTKRPRKTHHRLKLAAAIAAILFVTSHTNSIMAANRNATPEGQLALWSEKAGKPGDPVRGKSFYLAKQANDKSCSSCHTANPLNAGRHSSTGKELRPLAPAANPQAFSDEAKTTKWFRRNCNDVVGRECSPQEKADLIAFLISLKP